MSNLLLPFPPSVNSLFPGKYRRHKSSAYKAWLKVAKKELDEQSSDWKPHKGEVQINLLFKSPDKRRRDLDNLIKPVLDFLVTNKLIVGDDSRFVRKISAEWDNGDIFRSGCFIEIYDFEVE